MTTIHNATAGQQQVPGATLYYEVRGHGPVLLLISGGPADADIFAALADALADRYTVVTYDTRGNSRSVTDDGPADQSIELESDDAHRLLAALTSDPVYVFGNSSGALVGLDLLVRHPRQVRTLVAHEPPATELLSDAAQHRAHAQDVYSTYQRNGVGAAMARFMAGAGLQPPPSEAVPQSEPPPEMRESMDRMARNVEFFVAHRFRSITTYMPHLAALRSVTPRIVVAVGETSRGQVAHRAALALAERLGTDSVDFPGDHGGFVSNPDAFAERLDGVLRAH